jgi:tetratricopeptide (TPR) repeat protein
MLALHTAEELHRRAADYLSRTDDVDQEVVAHHHELGTETTKAAECYVRATIAAARRGDTHGVIRCSDKALRLGASEGDRFTLYMARADALQFAGRREEQGRAVEAAIAHAKAPGEKARALTARVALLAATGAHEKGLEVAKLAIAEAAESGDSDALAMAFVRSSWASLYAGHIDDAEEAIGAADALEAELSTEAAALIAASKGQIATARGDLGARLDAFQRSVELCRLVGDLRRAAQEESNLADTFNRLGAYEDAERALRAALEMTRRVGNKIAEAFALANLGYALWHLGRHSEALDVLDHADALAEEVGHRYLAIAVRVYRARALLAAGRAEDSAREAETAADEARRAEIPALSAAALTAAADAWLSRGDAAMALGLSGRALSIRDDLGALEEAEAEVFLTHARALADSGRRDEALLVARRGSARLEELAGKIRDPELRRRFFEDVDENRSLLHFAAS